MAAPRRADYRAQQDRIHVIAVEQTYRLIGGRSVSGIIGVLYTSVGFGALVGPSAAGFAFDVNHSYLVPILVSVG